MQQTMYATLVLQILVMRSKMGRHCGTKAGLTFLAPAVRCLPAPSLFTKTPVPSMTRSTFCK